MARQTIMLEGGPHDGEATGPVSDKRNHVMIGNVTRYRRTDRVDAFGRPIFEHAPVTAEAAADPRR